MLHCVSTMQKAEPHDAAAPSGAHKTNANESRFIVPPTVERLTDNSLLRDPASGRNGRGARGERCKERRRRDNRDGESKQGRRERALQSAGRRRDADHLQLARAHARRAVTATAWSAVVRAVRGCNRYSAGGRSSGLEGLLVI